MRISDWSSDVCSSDLKLELARGLSCKALELADEVGLVVKGVAHKVLPVDTLTGKAGSDSERAVLACEQLRRRTIDAVGQPLDLAPGKPGFGDQERKSVGLGKSVDVRVAPGGRRHIKKKKTNKKKKKKRTSK